MKILYLCYVWPEPQSSAAGIRSLEWIRWFVAHGVEMVIASAAERSVRSDDLGTQFPELRCQGVRPNHRSFDDWLRQEHFDLVVYDRYIVEEQFGGRITAALPAAIQWLDTIDLHHLRIGREAALGLISGERAEDARLRELASLYRVDRSFVVSRVEHERLLEIGFDEDQVAYLPWPVRIEGEVTSDSRDINGGVWIGNCRHPPNKDGLIWFLRDIWPELHAEFPQFTVELWGPYASSDWTKELKHASSGVTYRGPWNGSAQSLLRQYGFSLAPLRYGAGLKGKVLESLAAGTPVLGTAIAWEGIAAEDEELSCETAESWVERMRDWRKPTQWTRIQHWGRERLRRDFSAEVLDPLFEREFLTRRKTHHLVSSLLRHQTTRSTEYFSRWVELKNQLP